MFENRRWLVIPTSLIGSINFDQVLESNAESLQLSIDGSQTFVKYEINEILEQKKYMNKEIESKTNFFVMVGRYTRQKNHLLVIKCFKKLIKNNSDINLLIIGNGELRREYVAEINEIKIKGIRSLV